MRLIDADVVTTDEVSRERIGGFENSSAPRRRQGTCGSSTIYLCTNIEAYSCDPYSPWQRASKFTFEEGPILADSVAKVPKRRAAKFPLNDKTSGNRRSM
jgi:hypothetical protein